MVRKHSTSHELANVLVQSDGIIKLTIYLLQFQCSPSINYHSINKDHVEFKNPQHSTPTAAF